MQHTQVIIIGGGFSGLFMLKEALEQGLDAVLFEASDALGGQWKHNPTTSGGVMRDTETVSSRLYMGASDHPMPHHLPHFPRADQVLAHLMEYAHRYDLWPHIHLGTRVQRLSKDEPTWHVTTDQGQWTAAHVAICTGTNAVPRFADDPMFQRFSGQLLHSAHFERDQPDVAGKRVLVIGGSDNASDVAKALQDVADVTVSVRRGIWIQPKTIGYYNYDLHPTVADEPADLMSNRILLGLVRLAGADVAERLGARKRLEQMMGASGHGIPEWTTDDPYLGSVWTKSCHLLDGVRSGALTPRGKVVAVDGDLVTFAGRSEPERFDVIVQCTGFAPRVRFAMDPRLGHERYRLVFDAADPSLAWIGYIRPFVTSIPIVAELQARWAAAVFSGRATLPCGRDRAAQIQADQAAQAARFPRHAHTRPHVIDPYQYMEAVAQELGVQPRLGRLLLEDPRLAWAVWTNTWTQFQFRLHDPDADKRRIARDEILALQGTPMAAHLLAETYRTLRSLTPVRKLLRRVDGWIFERVARMEMAPPVHAEPEATPVAAK